MGEAVMGPLTGVAVMGLSSTIGVRLTGLAALNVRLRALLYLGVPGAD